jgi:hypothetical protein
MTKSFLLYLVSYVIIIKKYQYLTEMLGTSVLSVIIINKENGEKTKTKYSIRIEPGRRG